MKIKLFSSFLIASALTACGGGDGGGGGSAGGSAIPLSGSISQGAPIAGAKITLTDAKGTVIDGGTSAIDGSYTISDISSLTAPILISAEATVGGTPVTYRSLLIKKETANTANITPITDAVLIQTTGKSGAFIQAAANTELSNIDLAKLNSTTNKFVTSIANVLDQIASGTSSSFNPFTTKFVADGESAADKINDLLRITTTLIPSGAETDITDKSNSVGTVTITDGGNATSLPVLPQDLLKVNPKHLSDLVSNANYIFSSVANLDSPLFEEGFDDNFLDDGLDKAATINKFRTEYRDALIGAKFSNPKLASCDINNICKIFITLKNTNVDTVLSVYYRYDSVKKKFINFGNHNIFKARFENSLSKIIDAGVETVYSENGFELTNPSNPVKYNSGTLTLESTGTAPDIIYNLVRKPTHCADADGLVLDDGTNNCVRWPRFETNNQINIINEKIKRGGYVARFQAWTSSDRSGISDVVVIPVSDQLLSIDKLGIDGYPRINIVQGTASSLSYMAISNADDFTVSGTLCISSQSFCDHKNAPPHTTSSEPKGNVKMPAKIEAKSSDGWQFGEKINSYFIHVRDKAGRDIMINKYN